LFVVTAVNQFATLISAASREHHSEAIGRSRAAFIDTLACIYAGSRRPVAEKTLAAVRHWGQGKSAIIGQSLSLSPPFAALVNGAAAHALDYDDFDAPANAHPSAVFFPALLALAAERSSSGFDLLDAHIVGVEVMQRLGEAMNMDHYRRGWLSTLTLGSIGCAAACARLLRFDHVAATAALSLASSMASGLTNQGGYLAKQLNPGLAAKNGVMASALAGAGISASDQVIDGPISMARSMGDYNADKFAAALAKLGNPWSVVEHGLIMKAYPSCGYTHRLLDAAIDLHARLPDGVDQIRSILISVPDYYLDLLVYSRPGNSAEAMFSAEYNVAAALVRGSFGIAELSAAAIADPALQRLLGLTRVSARRPRDVDVVYDPADPDVVEVFLADGNLLRSEIGLPTGAVDKPMSGSARRAKFDQCLEPYKTAAQRDDLWVFLSCVEQQDDLVARLGL
jgi:2-methylcitrate dehydratase PrpD